VLRDKNADLQTRLDEAVREGGDSAIRESLLATELAASQADVEKSRREYRQLCDVLGCSYEIDIALGHALSLAQRKTRQPEEDDEIRISLPTLLDVLTSLPSEAFFEQIVNTAREMRNAAAMWAAHTSQSAQTHEAMEGRR
jgi:hypothetical protein